MLVVIKVVDVIVVAVVVVTVVDYLTFILGFIPSLDVLPQNFEGHLEIFDFLGCRRRILAFHQDQEGASDDHESRLTGENHVPRLAQRALNHALHHVHAGRLEGLVQGQNQNRLEIHGLLTTLLGGKSVAETASFAMSNYAVAATALRDEELIKGPQRGAHFATRVQMNGKVPVERQQALGVDTQASLHLLRGGSKIPHADEAFSQITPQFRLDRSLEMGGRRRR